LIIFFNNTATYFNNTATYFNNTATYFNNTATYFNNTATYFNNTATYSGGIAARLVGRVYSNFSLSPNNWTHHFCGVKLTSSCTNPRFKTVYFETTY